MEMAAASVPEVLAIVAGEPYIDFPTDLFIPPDALEVLMDSFSGPLDLLLYLIRRQHIDILDIPMTRITQQYMQYIQLMGESRLELAADYLVMAAVLAEIKSRMLLPVTPSEAIDGDEDDPRMALVRRLQAYEQFKEAAVQLDALPRYERDIFQVQLTIDTIVPIKTYPDITLSALTTSMNELMQRQSHFEYHQIMREPMSVRERMNEVLQRLEQDKFTVFTSLFTRLEGRAGLVVTLLAILELSRQSLLIIIQASDYSMMHLKLADHG